MNLKCQKCKRYYPNFTVADYLWDKIIGDFNGIYCPICFSHKAEKKGYEFEWIIYPLFFFNGELTKAKD